MRACVRMCLQGHVMDQLCIYVQVISTLDSDQHVWQRSCVNYGHFYSQLLYHYVMQNKTLSSNSIF